MVKIEKICFNLFTFWGDSNLFGAINPPYLLRYFIGRSGSRAQSFAQGNCQVKRLLTDGENLFFDYFSIYEIAEFRSYLIDVANMLVSLLVEDNSIQAKMFIVHTLKSYPKDIVLFWILLQEECQGEVRDFFEALWNKQ